MVLRPAILMGVLLVATNVSVQGEKEKNTPESSLIEKLSDSEVRKRLKVAEENLALAQTEADYFHEKWVELRLKHEALGLEALTANEKALEEKLVRIIGELYRSEKKRKLLEKALLDVIEKAKQLRSANPSERLKHLEAYEAATRAAVVLIERPIEQPLRIAPDINSGVITKVDETLNLAVVNFGKSQGARAGMPFRIIRGDKVIGRCRIAEVREYLSAIVVEGMIKNIQVQVGDRLILEAVK